MLVSYETFDLETYYLLFDNHIMAELFVDEAGAKKITADVQKIINNQKAHEVNICVSATTSDDEDYITIQVTDEEQTEILFETELYFKDYNS